MSLISFYNILGSIIFMVSCIESSWTPDIIPKLYIKYDSEKLPTFYGNSTDYFKLLDQDETSALIGAKNNVYNVSLSNLIENRRQRIEWISSDAHRELCALKGKHETDCQNYIRVFARVSEKQIMICGTNSYKPLCRYYNTKVEASGSGVNGSSVASSSSSEEENVTGNSLELMNQIEAQGRCPYNPTHNSTYVFTDGQLYSGTVADFSGADPLIYRETQRTEQYDLKQLNQPAFVSAVERNGYVLFFFREIAMEYMNCGKAIYSRVGRVCKNDKGGPYKFSDRWTSFLKTRLNCSVPGEYPFYFDEIQSTSKIIDGIYNSAIKSRQSIIYAVFTTPTNAIPGSAICAFYVDDIMDAFEGRFKSQKNATSNWLPIPQDEVPEPRPGKCVDDSRTLPLKSATFIKSHTLMEQSVPSVHNRPLLTRVNLKHRFTAITVDEQIEALDGNLYDVIYVGTDDGRVIKLVDLKTPPPPAATATSDNSSGEDTNSSSSTSSASTSSSSVVVITETQALPSDQKVRELSVSRHSQTLLVIGDGHIVSIPMHHCNKILHCRDCLNLQDPYCAWDILNHECVATATSKFSHKQNFIQHLPATGGGAGGSADLCKKHGESGNRIDPPTVLVQRGTLASVGRAQPVVVEYEHEITLTSIDGVELTNQINSNSIHLDPLVKESLSGGDGIIGGVGGINGESIIISGDGETVDIGRASSQQAGLKLGNASILVGMSLLFIAGLAAGVIISKLRSKWAPCYQENRNQINAYTQKRHIQPLNSGKDINLLMEANAYQCHHQKKDNLELEFAAKDRSHECKNSTETLEREVQCKTTGTLQKVKRTYL